MDKQTLNKLVAELREIIRLEEQFMKYSLLTPGDVISLKKLANKGMPRAEFLYGLMLLERRKHAEAIKWLNRCQRHCNGLFLWKLSKINYLLKDLSKDRINNN
jgi:hypothetical protein